MANDTQEAIAIAIVVLAGLYLAVRLLGVPERFGRPARRPGGTTVVLGSRLSRGLRARERTSRAPARGEP